MDRLRSLLVFVAQWYHSHFWNLHTDSTKHSGVRAAFFLQIYLHFLIPKISQYWNHLTSELDELWNKPVDPSAKKAQVKKKKSTSPLFLRFSASRKNVQQKLRSKTSPTTLKPVVVFQKNSFAHKVAQMLQTLRSGMAPTNRIIFSYYGHLLFSLIAIGFGIYGTGMAAYVFAFEDLPPVTDLVEKQQRMTTRILDRNGNLLFRIYEDENRTLIKLQDLPDHVIQSTIAIEDKSFYDHYGFSISGITRAFIANAQNEPIQGGSTITQQLVKNRLLSSERTLQRKVRELILAIQVSRTYSKVEVLEMYLNQVAYGGATYGVEEAAQLYFDKSARALSLGEASMLAGIPVAPSVYTPFGSRPELAFARQDEVLRRMVEDGYISQSQAEAAKSEVLQFKANRIDIQAPHFVMYVRELLAQKYGEKNIFQEGLEVTTTLDLNLHREVQDLVTAEVDSLANLNVQNGAALVTSPRTGEILAMVGSTNYFNFEQDGQVNVTLRPRQPGSSIKAITYALALSRGKTPHSVIEDTPITYQIAGSRPYSPRNYDGIFRGRVTLREALGSSYNIPAVKLLAEYGLEPFINLAERMGISTWQDRSRFGLSLTLGGGEVLMTDMAEAYGTFANYGNSVDLNPILEIKNAHGEVLYKNTCALEGYGCSATRALDPRVAYQITDILSDNAARTPAFGPQSVLNIPGQQVAVKTGTTNNLRDNWTIGYTTEHLVATWVGNNDNSPMSYVASGITGASPIWNNITRLVLDVNNPHIFPLPEGMISVPICAQTGTLTCRECPTTIEEVFIPGTEPSIACSAASFIPREFSQNANQNTGNTINRENQAGQVLEGWNSN